MNPSYSFPGAASGAHPREPELWPRVVAYLAFMVALWTVLCALSHSAPDLDGMEELVWASSFELGYSKHPPLPSWIMAAVTQLVGRPVWLAFLGGQLFSALGLWFVWRLGCEMTSPRKAFIATLLVSVSLYFSLRGTIYNHNTVQLWSIVAATWLFYRALKYQRLRDWAWLGVVAALATMTKYSAVIQFAAFFCFMLHQGSFAKPATWRGIVAALLAFCVTLSPHLYWLVTHDFEPFRYADGSLEAGGRIAALLENLDFIIDQAARLSPMLVVMLGLAFWTRRSRRGANAASTAAHAGQHADRSADVRQRYADALSAWDRSFLLWVGLTPFVSTVLISAILGTRLVASWGTTFFVLFGFYAFWWLRSDERTILRRVAILVVAVQVLMAVGYAVARGPIAWELGRTSRSTFPGPAVSQAMQKVWHEHVPSQPLRLVVSDTWLGGNVAIHAGRQAHVFIDGSFRESPWIDPSTALDCGALIVFSRLTRENPAPRLLELMQTATWRGIASVPWSSAKSPSIDLNWGIIPPSPQCRALPR